jgi:hypothetical protein
MRAVRADGGALPPVGSLSAPARGGAPTHPHPSATPAKKDVWFCFSSGLSVKLLTYDTSKTDFLEGKERRTEKRRDKSG